MSRRDQDRGSTASPLWLQVLAFTSALGYVPLGLLLLLMGVPVWHTAYLVHAVVAGIAFACGVTAFGLSIVSGDRPDWALVGISFVGALLSAMNAVISLGLWRWD